MSKIHAIARAVIRNESQILVAHCKKDDFFFLPGGHIKYCESAHETLVRELGEEMGIIPTIDSFIGILECIWDNKGKPFHEINFVFDAHVEGIDRN